MRASFETARERWQIPRPLSDSEAMASDKLDKTKAAPYEIIKQQKTNYDRSSTCAHLREARCGNSALRDLRDWRRAIDVSILITKETKTSA